MFPVTQDVLMDQATLIVRQCRQRGPVNAANENDIRAMAYDAFKATMRLSEYQRFNPANVVAIVRSRMGLEVVVGGLSYIHIDHESGNFRVLCTVPTEWVCSFNSMEQSLSDKLVQAYWEQWEQWQWGKM